MFAPWPEDIGRVARQRRVDLGLSQEDLAERSGVTRQWVSRFEQAKADVSFAKVTRVLRDLGLVVDIAPRSAPKSSESSRPPSDPSTVPAPSPNPALTPDLLRKMNQVVLASIDTSQLSRGAEFVRRVLDESGSLPVRRPPMLADKETRE